MNIRFRKLLMVMVGLVCVVKSAQSETCDWAKKTPPEDSQYKYFVAREYSTESRKDAMKNAEDKITQQVCDVLGSYSSSATDAYSTENKSKSTSSSAQRYRCLGIYKQNFEMVEMDDAKIDKNEYVACVKYKYLKENLRQEQERLNKEGPTSGSLALNEYVGDRDCAGQTIEIKTEPAGAYVSLDDSAKYDGITPLRFGNVCNGSHNLKITLKNYDTVEERISTSSDQQIFKKLKRSTKRVKLSSNLRDSTITISDADGFKLKSEKEPLSYDFLMGAEYKITASNDSANDITISRTFDRDSESSYAFSLLKHDGKIDFTVFKQRNPDVKIYVDGSRITKNETGALKADVSHSIEFVKPGKYKKIRDSKTVKPKETYSYPSKELVFKKGEDNEDRWYIGAYGIYAPHAKRDFEIYSSPSDLQDVSYDNMVGGGLTYGLKSKASDAELPTSIRLEAELQFVAAKKDCFVLGNDCYNTMDVYTLLGNVYAESFRPNSNYEYFLGVGLGFSLTDNMMVVRDEFYEYRTYENQSYFDLQLALGMSYKLTPDLMLDFGYKLLILMGTITDNSGYYSKDVDEYFTINQFSAGFRYLF